MDAERQRGSRDKRSLLATGEIGDGILKIVGAFDLNSNDVGTAPYESRYDLWIEVRPRFSFDDREALLQGKRILITALRVQCVKRIRNGGNAALQTGILSLSPN